MEHSEYFLIPGIAALALQLLNLAEVANLEPSRKPNFKDWVYWIPYFVNPIVAGFIGWLYFYQNTEQFGSLTAAAVGVSAPSILKSLVGTVRAPVIPSPTATPIPAPAPAPAPAPVPAPASGVPGQ